MAASLGLGALLLPLVQRTSPLLVWNASASMPKGLYKVLPHEPLMPGDLVIAWTPEPWRILAARRHYLPRNVPLVKRVAARQHDYVCAEGTKIWVNGHLVALRLDRDGLGRLMPWWEGCFTLIKHEYFLLGRDDPASFDGRYFGTTTTQGVIGKAELLWAW